MKSPETNHSSDCMTVFTFTSVEVFFAHIDTCDHISRLPPSTIPVPQVFLEDLQVESILNVCLYRRQSLMLTVRVPLPAREMCCQKEVYGRGRGVREHLGEDEGGEYAGKAARDRG